MKRAISILLTAALVLGLLAMSTTAFAAENTVLDSVRLEVDNFATGKSTEDITFTLPDGANYAIKSYSVMTEDETPVTGTLGEGTYDILIIVEPKAGYVFAEDDLSWNVDGDGMIMAANWETTADSITFFAKFNLYDPATTIDYIEIIVTGVEKGKNSADVKVTVPEGANYTAELNGIYDDYNETTMFSGVFGNALYRVDLVVRPKAGYSFLSDSAEYVVNAAGVTDVDATTRSSTYYGFTTAFQFSTPIDKVELTVTGMEVGKSASDVKVTVPEGANYQLDNFRIIDSEWNSFEGTFQLGIFTSDIYLTPADGYCFTDDTVATINGGDSDYFDCYNFGEMLNLEYDLDLRTPIDKVEVTVTGMEAGKPASDVKVTVPEGANYQVYRFRIVDSEWDSFVGTFQKDNFTNDIYLIPADGYCFTEDTVATINGEEPGYISTSDEGRILNLEYDLDLRTPIDKVELPAWPAIQVGDTIPGPQTVPGEKYAYLGVWAVNNGMASPGDKFENDQLYIYEYLIHPADGYTFAENVKVTVGGKTVTDGLLNNGDILGVIKSYRLGDPKVVDKLTLSGAAPTAGNAPGTITSSGTGYTLDDAYWGVANNGKGSGIRDVGETFTVGDYVYMGIEFQLEEDYVLDLNFKVLYNGKSYSPILERTETEENSVRTVICLGQLKAASNPDTGDATPVVALTVLTVASILGLGIMASRRKTF